MAHMKHAQGIDALCDLQDDLMTRLLAGHITPRRLPDAFARHCAALVKAGFKASEAAACFWDAVHTAGYLREQEGNT